MMEPVAWMNKLTGVLYCTSMGTNGTFMEPLVRLSDAEARIRELEAALDHDPDGSGLWRYWASKSSEIAQKLVEKIDHTTAAEARAEAAEALLMQAGPIIKALLEIRSVWTDPHNDDVCRAARAISDKIGGKDE